MPVFSYVAIESSAGALSGIIIADTPRQARDQLRAKGLTVKEIKIKKSANTQSGFHFYSGRRQASKLIIILRDFSTLLSVGVPLVEAIDSIADQYHGRLRASLLQLKEQVMAGLSLAEAMRQQPGLFDSLSVAMTEVGELSGNLDSVLENLAGFKERSGQLKGRIGTALLYPSIVLATGIGVSTFLMTFVVPNLLHALVQSGQPLPWVTQVVKGASDFLIDQWMLLLLAIALLIGGFTAALRTYRGKWLWHRFLLWLPGIGELVRKQAVLRIAAVTATLLRGGVQFIPALQIARKSTSNLLIRSARERCEQAISGGADIAAAAELTGVFPPPMIRVLSIGQQSGRLEEMLERLATDYDRHLAIAASRLTAMLEPILILMLAVIVGFVAFATILPILEMGNVI